jgi:transposase
MVYPEWVTKWKTKGTHVTRQGDRYYLNRVHSEWNREKGRAQLITDEYLGRITPDGLIEPKYKRMMKRYDQISVKEYGASSLLMHLSEDIRVALKDNFPEWREIFVFSCMRLIHTTTIKNLEFHFENSYLSDVLEVSTYPKHIGEMLRNIGMDRTAIIRFMRAFLSKSRYLAVDLTSVISLSEGVISAMLGHDSNNSHLPIVQLLLLFNIEDKEPSYYRILSGSITSVMSISSTMEESEISNIVLVGDTGFFSSGNVEDLEEKNIHYILPLKSNSRLIPYDREMKRYFLYEDRPVWYTLSPGKKSLYTFQDHSLKAEEEKDFLKREEGKRGAVPRFRAIENRMGKISVVTDLKVSGEVIYDMLKTRVDIEQAYDSLKNTIHADRTYVRDDYQLQGWMFVNFIALMLHYRIFNLLRKRGMLRHHSPRDVIEHLERISRLKIGDEWKYSEIPRKSRKIMEELDLHIMQN